MDITTQQARILSVISNSHEKVLSPCLIAAQFVRRRWAYRKPG